MEKLDSITKSIEERRSVVTVPSLSTTPSRRSQQPFPITLAFDVHCGSGLADVAKQMLSIKDDAHNKSATLLLDVQKILAEEFNAAYDFLNSHSNGQLWSHCTPQLEAAVRQKDGGTLKVLCDQFRSQIAVSDTAPTPLNHLSDRQRFTVALAWAIIVESALLNERLVEDIAHLASAKNAHHLRTDWLPYYGPHPPIDAVMAFNDYVCCRWPIHVVAIDPVTQDQNVADSFSQRRELQLALSLAFASGRIGAQNFTRMARQLELDMETVSLNRTSVGFSHGDNTFGWRFQPRIQSPDTKGNIRTFAETLFTGGSSRDSILKQSRLEPGTRECTAIVIMPSFVPYVLFDMRTNWFRLTDPSQKEFDLHDGMELSAEVVELHQLSQQCVSDQNKYRHGDVHRLMRSVDQLETRLPLQTKYVQMPFENSLGGFEFFNTGTPDLAPELKGYYGEPGLSQEHKTTIFLVGDHFSVHETKVIVGGQSVTAKLLSRQVMEITVDPVFNVLNKNVDIHVATPYGVSNHIDVPVIPKTASTAVAEAIAKHELKKHLDQFQWNPEEVRIQISTDAQCHVSTAKLLDGIAIENGKDMPFGKYRKVEMRAWISTVSNEEAAEPVRLSDPLIIGPRAIDNTKGLVDKAEFEDAIGQLLRKVGLSRNTEKLVAEAYLALTDEQGVSQIVKIENELTLEVELCNGACDQPDPEAHSPQTSSLIRAPLEVPARYQMQNVNTRASQLLTIPPSQLR